MVGLAQHPAAEIRAAAEAAAAFVELPLETIVVGDEGLERDSAELLAGS